jgi:molybdopterin-guanine dinucleotide biosynthesis protein A
MGQDKALMPFLGQPLIQRVVERVACLADEILVTANHPDSYQFLEIPIFPDVIPDLGALGGVYTALKVARKPLVAMVACDLPFANPNLLAACRDRLIKTSADAVIPSSERGLEPLHAVYRREMCLLAVEAALQAGQRRVISWHQNADVHILPPEEVARYNPHGVTFWNVNTPEEFQQAEAKALELDRGGK